MADKRTTPEAPQEGHHDAQHEAIHGSRSKKRSAPTIDLTATEVKPPQDDSPPQPPPVREQSSSDHAVPPLTGGSGSADNPSRRMSASLSASTLAAGFIGAATVTAILFGLWFTGLVPVHYVGSAAMGTRVAGLEMQIHDLQSRPAAAGDTKSVDELTQRVSKIEDTFAKVPVGDVAVAERFAAADNAMKSLGLALTALTRRNDDIAGNAVLARERAEAAEKAVTELRASVQDITKNSSAGIAPAEIDALQKRVAALEQSAKFAQEEIAKTAATDTPARLALSAAALRDATLSGAPFSAELTQVKSLGADEKALALLEPFAATGVPSQVALARELQALVPAMLKASGAQAPAGGFLDRLQANAGKLVRIRPVDAPPRDDPPAVLARIEIAAANADIAAALSDLGKLSDATRAPTQGWIAKAQAREAAVTAARQFAADAARTLGSRWAQ
jgi:hypothetical protein